jgi:hypothetical protein
MLGFDFVACCEYWMQFGAQVVEQSKRLHKIDADVKKGTRKPKDHDHYVTLPNFHHILANMARRFLSTCTIEWLTDLRVPRHPGTKGCAFEVGIQDAFKSKCFRFLVVIPLV